MYAFSRSLIDSAAAQAMYVRTAKCLFVEFPGLSDCQSPVQAKGRKSVDIDLWRRNRRHLTILA